MTSTAWGGERWLPAPGFPTYEVSDNGRVRSLKHGALRSIKTRPNPGGYARFTAYVNGVAHYPLLHHLVLTAFVGERPEGLWGLHQNGDRMDARFDNLYWGTPSQNAQDRVRHGHHELANRTHCPHGHEYTVENTYRAPASGNRQCRVCRQRIELARPKRHARRAA